MFVTSNREWDVGLWGDESQAGASQDMKPVRKNARKPQPPGCPSLRICVRDTGMEKEVRSGT